MTVFLRRKTANVTMRRGD